MPAQVKPSTGMSTASKASTGKYRSYGVQREATHHRNGDRAYMVWHLWRGAVSGTAGRQDVGRIILNMIVYFCDSPVYELYLCSDELLYIRKET